VSPKDVYPGILQLLQDLRGQGIKIALASASKWAILLKQMQITEYFDAIADRQKWSQVNQHQIFSSLLLRV
jgi:beta-phosphoglucomutase